MSLLQLQVQLLNAEEWGNDEVPPPTQEEK